MAALLYGVKEVGRLPSILSHVTNLDHCVCPARL
jgi:hypothetical protein